MYQRAVQVALNGLTRAEHLARVAQTSEISGIWSATLADDMFPLETQLRIAVGFTLRACLPLVGESVPAPDESITLFQAVNNARKTLNALSPEMFAGAADRQIAHKAGFADVSQTGVEYLDQFAIPNMWFHLSAAYMILRSHGVAVGKADFDGVHGYPAGFSWV